MRIRTITLGIPLSVPLVAAEFEHAGRFMAAAKRACEEAGYEVQTTRLAIQLCHYLLDSGSASAAIQLAKDIEQRCLDQGIDYVSLGTIFPEASAALLPLIPQLLAATSRCFFSATVASRERGIDIAAIRQAAETVKQIAEATPGGFGNHNFCTLANCPPNIPYFPAAYHNSPDSTFTIGLECADLVYHAFDDATSLDDARRRLVNAVEGASLPLEAIANQLAQHYGIAFGGLDISTAPYPDPQISTAAAIERLGVGTFGAHGTLFAAALITDALRQSRVQRAGYSGLFLPIMEDAVLAARNIEGTFTLDSLLLYSAVCGTGLDAIPLPGAISVDDLARIILDVATLATTLNKPLSARLVPLPNKEAGDMTEFAYAYFANTRVVAPRTGGDIRLVGRDSVVQLAGRGLV